MDYSIYPRHNVLCIDIRSFYASVEAIKLGLDPMKAMLAVVGDLNRPGSIVLAASPALKQRYHIGNVSRFFELPKNPQIYKVQAHMADYIDVSTEITKMMLNYFPQEAIHPYSIDEMWVTLDGLENHYGDAWETAKLLQQKIFQNFGLTSAIGIGDNKFLAKVILDIQAKKTAIAECRYEDVAVKLWPVPIELIWGIGSRMKRNLNGMGIFKLGQIANFPLPFLKKRFGVMGEQLYWHAWGIDLSPVFGDFIRNEQKGFGHGISLLRDYNAEETLICILDLCEEVCRRARTAKKIGKTIHLAIHYSHNNKGNGFNRSQSIPNPTNITMVMYEICTHLFWRFYDGTSKIRRISVSLDQLFPDHDTQLSLWENEVKKKEIGFVMDQIRDKYGSTAILRASSYTKAGILIERSKKIGGHYA